jgi:hypothetical protein
VKDCYAFQQYDAAYALCRTLIEATVRDICVRRQLFPKLAYNVILLEEIKWKDLLDRVSSRPLRERLRILYGNLCVLIHGQKDSHRKRGAGRL